jgi:hypothetical protein
LYGIELPLPFTEPIADFGQCARFDPFTSVNQHDSFGINFRRACNLSYSDIVNLFSEFCIGDCFVVGVFRAVKIYETWVVALFPTTRRFFSYVAMLTRDDVTSSQQSSR